MGDASRQTYREDASYEADWYRAVNGADAPAQTPYRTLGRGASRTAGEGAPRTWQGTPGARRAQQPAGGYAASREAGADPYAAAQQPARKPRGRRKPGGCYVFLSWVALFCWAAFIYYMSAHTSSELGQGVFAHVREVIQQLVWTYYGYVEDPVSPIGHFCEYFIFGALLGNALHCHMPLLPATFLAIACASGYGYTDEVHQLSVAGRYFDLEDWKVDTIAATLGSFLASTIFFIFAKRPR